MSLHAFTHEAMNTEFGFRIRHAKPDYARQAAHAAFAEVDRLETLLSRYAEGGDVWRINHAKTGETITLSEDVHACLMQALEIFAATKGAFDVTVGNAALLARKYGAGKIPSAKLGETLARSAKAMVSISPDEFSVHVAKRGMSIDLGAIGKGYALDRARALLAEWEIKHALLSAGGSSLLAIGEEKRAAISARGAAKLHGLENIITAKPKPGGWLMNVRGEKQAAPLTLHDCALGASGTSVLGRHIIDPRRGGQSYTHVRAWALAPTAAVADALSTAFMTMMPHEIAAALRVMGKGHAAITEDTNGRLHVCRRSGVWAQIKRTHALSWPA